MSQNQVFFLIKIWFVLFKYVIEEKLWSRGNGNDKFENNFLSGWLIIENFKWN